MLYISLRYHHSVCVYVCDMSLCIQVHLGMEESCILQENHAGISRTVARKLLTKPRSGEQE